VISTHATAAEAFEALEHFTERLQRFHIPTDSFEWLWSITSGGPVREHPAYRRDGLGRSWALRALAARRIVRSRCVTVSLLGGRRKLASGGKRRRTGGSL
jgi:hypothetical protein